MKINKKLDTGHIVVVFLRANAGMCIST